MILNGQLATVELVGRRNAINADGPTYLRRGAWKVGAFVPDLWRWIALWRERKVAFSGPTSINGATFAMVSDPEGVRVQLFVGG
jgi:hypothetical protein